MHPRINKKIMQGGYESKYFYNVAVLGGKNTANRQGSILYGVPAEHHTA
jgi:hypothetical protein